MQKNTIGELQAQVESIRSSYSSSFNKSELKSNNDKKLTKKCESRNNESESLMMMKKRGENYVWKSIDFFPNDVLIKENCNAMNIKRNYSAEMKSLKSDIDIDNNIP